MAWIESHQSLINNGKLLELANKLRINKHQAIGHLHALWWWALDNTEDGNLKRFCNATVTLACGWTDYLRDLIQRGGDLTEIAGVNKIDFFVDALIETGFLDQRDNGLWIHNWQDYTHRYYQSVTQSAKKTLQTRLRVQKHRRSNAHVTLMKRSVTHSTIPNHTIPNLTKDKDKDIAGKPQSVQSKIPLTEIQQIVTAWKLLTGIDPDDKVWDKVHFPRCAKSAQSLLSLFRTVNNAVDCMEYVYNDLTRRKLDCTIETMVKHSDRFREFLSKKEAQNGVLGS